jgi:hypothetical protein
LTRWLEEAELAIFADYLSTFAWDPLVPTPTAAAIRDLLGQIGKDGHFRLSLPPKVKLPVGSFNRSTSNSGAGP